MIYFSNFSFLSFTDLIHDSSGSQMETALPCVSEYMVVCHMTGVEEGDGELLGFDGWGSGMLSI